MRKEKLMVGASASGREPRDLLWHVPAVRGVSWFSWASNWRFSALRAAARPRRCAPSRAEQPTAGDPHRRRAGLFGASGVNIPAEKPGLDGVQSYAIWPHMTVFENVATVCAPREQGGDYRKSSAPTGRCAFGARRSQLSADSSASRWRARSCSSLRCAVRRAGSNLDAAARRHAHRAARLQHRLGITSVYVTHDLEEALAMSDRIVVMKDGLIGQVGSPLEIYNHPRNAFVADFVGSANLIRGRNRTDLAIDDVLALETPAGQVVYGMAHGRPAGAELTFSIRTVHLQLSAAKPGATQNVSAGAGRTQRVPGRLHADPCRLGRSARRDPRRRDGAARRGSEAFLSVEPRRVVLLEE